MTGETETGPTCGKHDSVPLEKFSIQSSPPSPRPSQTTLIHQPSSYVERLDLRELFPIAQPLEVELGSGDGSFLAEYARANPTRNLLGIERLLGRLRKLDRKGRRMELGNLKLIRLEASYVVEYLLPRESIRALHIYFPDPWPKRRHQARRLINPKFAEAARLAMEFGGQIFLRTDDPDYFAQILEVFGSNSAFKPIETPDVLSALVTDFEREFQARGIPTLRAGYQRQA